MSPHISDVDICIATIRRMVGLAEFRHWSDPVTRIENFSITRSDGITKRFEFDQFNPYFEGSRCDLLMEMADWLAEPKRKEESDRAWAWWHSLIDLCGDPA